MIGRYYAVYNHYDSYPDGLGKDLVNGIPKGQKGYPGEIRLKNSGRKKNTGHTLKQNGWPS